MGELNFHYVDRPPLKSTEHHLINISAFDNAVSLEAAEINDKWGGLVLDVKDEDGDVAGTVVYFPSISYEDLTSWSLEELG